MSIACVFEWLFAYSSSSVFRRRRSTLNRRILLAFVRLIGERLSIADALPLSSDVVACFVVDHGS
jgi:hypothetical protein